MARYRLTVVDMDGVVIPEATRESDSAGSATDKLMDIFKYYKSISKSVTIQMTDTASGAMIISMTNKKEIDPLI